MMLYLLGAYQIAVIELSVGAGLVTVLLVCALSVGSAVFLVLEMDGPFDGLLKVSADPLRSAHARLAQ